MEDMAEPRWLTDAEERSWRSYRAMRTLLDLEIARDLKRDSGLSEADYDVLSTLSESTDGSWRASAFAERLRWSTSRLAHQVGRMEQRGLVERRGTDYDARGAVVALTDDGWATVRAAAPPHVESVRRNLIDLLTPAEIKALHRIASKVVENLRDGV
jgi:DNA-binding MarR family transcriptional regulator